MTYEEIQIALQDRILQVVADRTGLNPMTVNKIARGKTKKPHNAVLRVLSDYLQNNLND